MRTRQSDPSSKSEQVRKRRNQQGQEQVKRSPKMNRYSSDAPTVFVRGVVVSGANPTSSPKRRKTAQSLPFQPVINRAKTNPRRKVTIPLGSNGAEAILPAVPTIKFGWRLASFVLVAVLTFALYSVWNSPEFTVGLPEVTGLERLTVDDLETILEIQGTPVFLLDVDYLQQATIEAFPELKDVTVSIALPNHVVITAVERQPVIAWTVDDETLWVDSDGSIFPARGTPSVELMTVNSDVLPPLAALPADLLAQEEARASGEIVSASTESTGVSLYQRQVDSSIYFALVTMSEQMPSGMNLAYHKNEGFGWHDDDRGWDVYFGQTLENLDTKLALYEQMVVKVDQLGLQPTLISVAHIHAPYYSLEQ